LLAVVCRLSSVVVKCWRRLSASVTLGTGTMGEYAPITVALPSIVPVTIGVYMGYADKILKLQVHVGQLHSTLLDVYVQSKRL